MGVPPSQPAPGPGEIPWLTTARVLAMGAVVVVHAASSTVAFGPFGTAGWWAATTMDALTRWCVPVFVMVSGALLLDPTKTERARDFYRKRVARLLIPTVFWSVFFLALSAGRDLALGVRPDVGALGDRLLSGRPHYHLWYLYMIVPLFALTPLLRRAMHGRSRVQLWTGALLLLAASMAFAVAHTFGGVPSGPFLLWCLPYLAYFVLGHLIASSSARPHVPAGLVAFAILGGLTAAGLFLLTRATDLDGGLYFFDNFGPTVVPMSLLAFWLLQRVPTVKWMNSLGGLTLGVYLIHPVFLSPMNDLHMASGYPAPALVIPAMTVLSVLLSAAATLGLSQTPYLRRIV